MTKEEFEKTIAFPLGPELNSLGGGIMRSFGIGEAYLSTISTGLLNIRQLTCAPLGRTHWHTCLAKSGGGQVLVCTGGKGVHVEEGKPPVRMKKGSVVNVPVGVNAWQGADADSWFSFLYIEVPGTDCGVSWNNPVGDKEYMKAM